jgi:CBS domain-containing protein
MLERGFRHLPVVDGDRVVGIVSLRDLSRAEP